MEDQLELIRAAVAVEATAELKATGVAACRAVLAALEGTLDPSTAAPKAPALPVAEIASALRGLPASQLLDLAIARLRAALPAGSNVAAVPALKLQLVPIPQRGAS